MTLDHRWRTLLRERWVEVLLGLGIVAQCLPLLLTRVLPFHDAAGIVGPGVGARPPATIRGRATSTPSTSGLSLDRLLRLGLAGASLHVPSDAAFNVFIALFCLAGPPWPCCWCCGAFGKPRPWPCWRLPIGYHHQIWYGFLGSAAAITGLLLALAFARALIERPRPGNHLGLAAAMLFVALCHPFALAMTLAVVAPLLFWPPGAALGRSRPGSPASAHAAVPRGLGTAVLRRADRATRATPPPGPSGSRASCACSARRWARTWATSSTGWAAATWATSTRSSPAVALVVLAIFLAGGVRGEPPVERRGGSAVAGLGGAGAGARLPAPARQDLLAHVLVGACGSAACARFSWWRWRRCGSPGAGCRPGPALPRPAAA
jgi:hypothetical protein